jgi:hypothetical protein
MSKLRLNITVSLDGFVAGPYQSEFRHVPVNERDGVENKEEQDA